MTTSSPRKGSSSARRSRDHGRVEANGSPATGPSGFDLGQLLKGMHKAGNELRKTPEVAKAYLLSTGFYTKDMKLKKRFR